MTMSTTTTTDTLARVNLAGQAPQLENLPEGLFDTEEPQALATFAALCTSANVKSSHVGGDGYLVTINSLALQQLALFAAGAQVWYRREDYRQLERLARECANDSNHELVSWVLRCAYHRARELNIVGPGTATAGNHKPQGYAEIDPVGSRDYAWLAEDLSAELFEEQPRAERNRTQEERHGQALFARFAPKAVAHDALKWKRKRLLTYAAVMGALKPRYCSQQLQAVVLLALYGAEADVTFSRHQYELLYLRAEGYRLQLEDERFENCRNRQMVAYVLQCAGERAEREGLVRR